MRKLAGVLAGVLVGAAAVGLSGGASAAGAPDLVVTAPASGSPNIRTFAADGTPDASFESFGNNGASVAAGDINGDGQPDIVTGTGPGVEAQVQVRSKDGNTLIAQANPFPGFMGGITVAAANEDTTAQSEVIVAAGPGGGPHIKVLRFNAGQLVDEFSFMAYAPSFTGGVFVAGAGGRIITGAGAGGGPHVRVFQIQNSELSVQAEWMAYNPAFTGGVHVAAGNVRTTTETDVVTGAGPGGGPHVQLWSLAGAPGPATMAYDQGFTGGVWVGVGTGQRLITGAGAGGGPHVKVMSYGLGAFSLNASFMAYTSTYSGGVRVGGFPAATTPSTTTTTSGGSTTTHPSTTTTTAPGSTTTTSCTGIPPVCV